MCDSYSLENRIRRAVDQLADQVALAEGELLARVGDERVAALAALLGVAEHRRRGRRRRSARSRARRPASTIGRQLDQPGLAHRAGVERGELRHRGVGGAHEPGGVAGPRRCAPSRSRRRAAPARSGSRRSPRRPRPTSTGRRPSWPSPKHMLAAHAAAPDLEVVDEEGDRELVELLDDQGVGELAPEGHQVVGGDGAGDEQRHAHGRLPVRYRYDYPAVAPSVEGMTPAQPVDPPRLRRRRHPAGDVTPTAAPPATHLRLQPRRRGGRRPGAAPRSTSRTTRARSPKREIRISEAAARIANALHLHLD